MRLSRSHYSTITNWEIWFKSTPRFYLTSCASKLHWIKKARHRSFTQHRIHRDVETLTSLLEVQAQGQPITWWHSKETFKLMPKRQSVHTWSENKKDATGVEPSWETLRNSLSPINAISVPWRTQLWFCQPDSCAIYASMWILNTFITQVLEASLWKTLERVLNNLNRMKN